MNEIGRRLSSIVVVMLASAASYAGTETRLAVLGVSANDIGTLGGEQSIAYDINNRRTVVGWAETPNGVRHAFMSRGSLVLDIGLDIGPGTSEARGINNHNVIVGTAGDLPLRHAFRWDSGDLRYLEHHGRSLDPMESEALAISDLGFIAGNRIFWGLDHQVATVWTDAGKFLSAEPDTVRSLTFAYDINDAADVPGRRPGWYGAVVWRYDFGWRGFQRFDDIPGLFGIPRMDGEGLGVNRHRVVVGYQTVPDYELERDRKHAVLWDGRSDSSIDIGTLPTGVNSVAHDINSSAVVVGYADRAVAMGPGLTVLVESAFIWHRDFGMFRLPALPATPALGHCHAYALNDIDSIERQVQVVGFCDTNRGKRAVRWDIFITPVAVIDD